MFSVRKPNSVPPVESMGLLVSNVPFGIFKGAVILTVSRNDEYVAGVTVNGRPVTSLENEARAELDAYAGARVGGPCVCGSWKGPRRPSAQGQQISANFVANVIPLPSHGWRTLPQGAPPASLLGVYVGVVAWSPKQLKNELMLGIWRPITDAGKIEQVLACEPDAMFDQAKRLAGRSARGAVARLGLTCLMKTLRFLDRSTFQGVESDAAMASAQISEYRAAFAPDKQALFAHELCALSSADAASEPAAQAL